MVADSERTLRLDQETPYRPGAKLPALIVLQGESVGFTIRLENDRTIIGRGAQADIVLRDDVASRQHAEIVSSVAADGSAEYYLKDLASTNGSFINGARVISQQLLRDGDKVKIGNHLLKFSLLDEVEAKALIKSKTALESHLSKSTPAEHTLCFPPFNLSADVDLLYRGETVVPLEPRAVKVLRYLVEHHDRVVPKGELLEAVWPDVFTTDGVLKKAISQARRALCDDPKSPSFIETYHSRGYRFIAPVQRRVRHFT